MRTYFQYDCDLLINADRIEMVSKVKGSFFVVFVFILLIEVQ